MTTSLPWQQRIGNQRDWIWRGWHTRYTYLRAGQSREEDPPLLLLHGFGASIGHWRHNLPELAQHHTVYALDLLGFGASEKAHAPYTVSFWVEQVYDFWRTFIGRPVVLVGNSIGSLVCLAAAALHPEMAQGLVLLNLPDSSLLELPSWVRPILRVAGLGAKPAIALVKAIFTCPIIFSPLFRVIRQPAVVRVWARQAYATSEAITEELVEILTLPARDRRAARALSAMINAKAEAEANYTAKVVLPTMKIPILLFWGLKDQMVPPSLARSFVKHNPSIKLIELENAGHCPHDECPEEVNREILLWMTALGATSY